LVGLSGVKIEVPEHEPIDNTLRRFKRAVNQSGHLIELRHKEFWENAHDKRKRKAERAVMLNRMERNQARYEAQMEGGSEYNS
jgi:ribosomal protein S21